MKAKMISFCEEQFAQILPVFDDLHEALKRAHHTKAIVIFWGKDYNGRESWLIRTFNFEKAMARAAVAILRNSLPVLAEAGYADLLMKEAIEWFESRYSLYPKEKPELNMVERSNELCIGGKKQSEEIRAVRRLAFDMIERPAEHIVSYFLNSLYANEHLKDEIREILQMIEEEIDKLI